MPTFMEAAACGGRRPRLLASLRCFPRADLISRLLRDRQVARFVVAPDGFGKSSLAFGYADTVFSFQHVMWINGKSPCFIRDLDKGVIASEVMEVDSDAALVVIDDVPALAPERVNALSAEIDRLLADRCEVLVCCAPSCDAFGTLQRDRLKLDSTDLLIADDSASQGRLAASADLAERIAGLRRESGMSARSFLAGIAGEELPADLILAMVVVLILQEGDLSELEAFGSCGVQECGLLARGYPFLGISMDAGAFCTPAFSIDDIAAAFAKKLDAAAQSSRFATRSDLAQGLADALLARGDGKRACHAVSAMCSQAAKGEWLERQRAALARCACLLPALDLSAEAGRRKPIAARPAMEADDAWRCAALGDIGQARVHARRAVACPDEFAQVMGLLTLRRHGEREEAAQASKRLAGWAGSSVPEGGLDVGSARCMRPLASLGGLSSLPAEKARLLWDRWGSAGAHPDVLTIAALWLFQDACTREEAGVPQPPGTEMPGALDEGLLLTCARFVAGRLEASPGPVNAFAALACSAWGSLRRRRPVGNGVDPLGDPAAARAARDAEDAVIRQRRELESRKRARDRRRRDYAATHPDSFLDGRYRGEALRSAPHGPLLTVKLFGGVEAWLGDMQVDPEKLRRQKVKTLLALLVLHRGRELSRDRLLAMMWPESDIDAARKSFYTIWSLLRSALSLPDGTCPYLVRQQNVCRLNGSLLRSDVADLGDVCHALMFEDMSTDDWARLATDVDLRFSDELMPGEKATEAIGLMRSECRTRLVDALVAASRRLGRAGRVRESLWFSRAALRRDRSREDAYTALMRAQVAAGQRSAALETYFDCRRFLAEELGIDPSPETMEVYRNIIESEEGLE